MNAKLLQSIQNIVNYNISEEESHYEAEHNTDITGEHEKNPDLLENQEHILYDLLVVQKFLNEQNDES